MTIQTTICQRCFIEMEGNDDVKPVQDIARHFHFRVGATMKRCVEHYLALWA
jgi:hypothetical protein